MPKEWSTQQDTEREGARAEESEKEGEREGDEERKLQDIIKVICSRKCIRIQEYQFQ